MCTSCTTYKQPTLTIYAREEKYDPTRTLTIRRKFSSDMKRRFGKLSKDITYAIVEQDCFGLRPAVYVGRKEFAFTRTTDKVNAFMDWLDGQVKSGILETQSFNQLGSGAEKAWTNMYISDSYKRGVIRARYEMGKAGLDVPSMEETGGINTSMSNPFHIDRLGVLYSRVFKDLKGITDAMDNQISKVLTQGIADGDNPKLLARKLVKTINGGGTSDLGITDTLGRYIPAARRAELLARTEIIRAHHTATVQEYKNWQITGVTIKAEFATASDDRVCPQCSSYHGKSFTIKEVENLIPIHPQCRCITLPEVIGKPKAVVKPTPIPVPTPQPTPIPAPIKQEAAEKAAKEAAEKISPVPNKYTYTKHTKPTNDDEIQEVWQDFYDKYRIYLDDMSYGAKVETLVMDKINEVGESVGNHILSKYPKLAELFEDRRALLHVEVNVNLPRNIYGQYNTTSRMLNSYNTLSISKQAMIRTTDTLTLGKGNVGLDFATTIRHEFGHHIYYKTLGRGVQNEWEKFFGVNKSLFKKVSKYASSEPNEAFAEAFAAYTSPLYKKGMMPKEIEGYMENLLGNRNVVKKVVEELPKPVSIPKPVEVPIPKPKPVLKYTKKPYHKDMWNEFYNEYHLNLGSSKQIKDTIEEINIIGETLVNDIYAKFPIIKNVIKWDGRTVNLVCNTTAKHSSSSAIAWFQSNIQSTIHMTSECTKGIEKLNLGGFSISGGHLSPVFRHEFGHFLYHDVFQNNISKWDEFYAKNKILFDKVSIYSKTNADEGFSEAFTAYTSSLYKKGMMPEEIENMLEEIIGKRVDNVISEGQKVAKELKIIPSADSMASCVIGGSVNVYKPSSCDDFVRVGTKESGYTWHRHGKAPDAETMERINKLRIPPGWTDVVVATDPHAKIQAMGMDAAGRWQYRYSAEWVEKQAQEKFKRVRDFAADMPSIMEGIQAGINNGDLEANLLRMDRLTSIRAGKAGETVAKKKAYGLTTLKKEHIHFINDEVAVLKFVAKEGLPQTYYIQDPQVIKFLMSRYNATRMGDNLFDTTAEKVNDYLKKLAGRPYTLKDFRTYNATRYARELLEKYAGNRYTAKEIEAIKNEVSTEVSRHLHNTPIMALNQYIDPMVWDVIQ